MERALNILLMILFQFMMNQLNLCDNVIFTPNVKLFSPEQLILSICNKNGKCSQQDFWLNLALNSNAFPTFFKEY